MNSLQKYPRTQHLEGSRRQPGDEDLSDVPFAEIADQHIIVEEKLDGANSAISFHEDGSLLLQSRGHYLTGGPREKHFALFKTWASTHAAPLCERLGMRYVMFGEWLLAKHTIFYDTLPHYFLEFDVYDRQRGVFLSTKRRKELLSDSPVTSVPVLHSGEVANVKALRSMIAPSLYKSAQWKQQLADAARAAEVDPERAQRETDRSNESEGLYLKIETDDCVTRRFKFVRESFLTSVVDSGSHWLSRPIVRNQLRTGVDIFSGREPTP